MSFFKDVFSVGFSKGGEIFFSLTRAIIIARWLGPELNGTIAALLVYPSLFLTIGSLGIRQSTAFFIGQGIISEMKIKNSILQLWVLSSILCLIFCFFLMHFFSPSGENIEYVIFAILPIPFQLINTYISGIFLGKNQIKEFNKVNWLPSFFILVLTVILVIFLELSVKGVLIALAVGPFFMSIILLRKADFGNLKLFDLDLNVLKEMLSLGIVYALSLLLINLNYKIDIIFLDKFSSDYQTGIYSKGVSIIDYLWQIPMLLSTIIFARSVSAKNSYHFSLKVVQLLRVSFIIISLASLGLFFSAPLIIQFLYGKVFLPSSEVMKILIPGVILLTIFKVLNMDLAGRGKPWLAMKAMGPSLIINIFLNFLLIPAYGANGAAIASTISYTMAAIFFIIIYKNETKIRYSEILKFSILDFHPIITQIRKISISKNQNIL